MHFIHDLIAIIIDLNVVRLFDLQIEAEAIDLVNEQFSCSHHLSPNSTSVMTKNKSYYLLIAIITNFVCTAALLFYPLLFFQPLMRYF